MRSRKQYTQNLALFLKVATGMTFIFPILVGVVFLKKGFSLKRAYHQAKAEGLVLPVVLAVLFVFSLAMPSLFKWSEEGPGSLYAPWIVALICGAVVGVLAQRSRLCMAGGLRDVVMIKDFTLLSGFLAIWVTVTIGNLILGNYKSISI